MFMLTASGPFALFGFNFTNLSLCISDLVLLFSSILSIFGALEREMSGGVYMVRTEIRNVKQFGLS